MKIFLSGSLWKRSLVSRSIWKNAIRHIADKFIKKRSGILVLPVTGRHKIVNIRVLQIFAGGKLAENGPLGGVLLQTAGVAAGTGRDQQLLHHLFPGGIAANPEPSAKPDADALYPGSLRTAGYLHSSGRRLPVHPGVSGDSVRLCVKIYKKMLLQRGAFADKGAARDTNSQK